VKNLVKEFKEFVNRGNLVELAVAFVLALFFTPIVTALVDGVVMNLIAAIFGQPDFNSITISVGEAELLIGAVITAIVQFILVAIVCFFIVKGYNAMRRSGVEAEAAPNEVDLLIEIRDELRSRVL
jgi:large conductance mechanosensitive channel